MVFLPKPKEKREFPTNCSLHLAQLFLVEASAFHVPSARTDPHLASLGSNWKARLCPS